jgi:glycosyltransferase involved in cell wall biosynthesis
MKIAMGVPEDLGSKKWNGFITAFRDLNRALAGHERVVFAPKGGDIQLHGAVRSSDGLASRYYNTLALSRDFAKKLGKTNADVVLAFTMMGLFLPRKHIYYTSNVPYKKVVELVRDEYPDTPRFRKLIDYYRFVAGKEKKNYEKAGKIIVLSHKIRELIISEHGMEPDKIIYIPRPIPKLYGDADSPAKGAMKLIFMPAELRVMKGVRSAIETMKILKKEVPDAVLLMRGRLNNYEEKYMRRLIGGARGKANIIVAGFLPKERFYHQMELADCAFMPFCFDECPISLTECIGSLGYCASHGDAVDQAEGLARLLTDEKFRRRKIAGAKMATERFTFDSYSRKINDAFEKFREG